MMRLSFLGVVLLVLLPGCLASPLECPPGVKQCSNARKRLHWCMTHPMSPGVKKIKDEKARMQFCLTDKQFGVPVTNAPVSLSPREKCLVKDCKAETPKGWICEICPNNPRFTCAAFYDPLKSTCDEVHGVCVFRLKMNRDICANRVNCKVGEGCEYKPLKCVAPYGCVDNQITGQTSSGVSLGIRDKQGAYMTPTEFKTEMAAKIAELFPREDEVARWTGLFKHALGIATRKEGVSYSISPNFKVPASLDEAVMMTGVAQASCAIMELRDKDRKARMARGAKKGIAAVAPTQACIRKATTMLAVQICRRKYLQEVYAAYEMASLQRYYGELEAAAAEQVLVIGLAASIAAAGASAAAAAALTPAAVNLMGGAGYAGAEVFGAAGAKVVSGGISNVMLLTFKHTLWRAAENKKWDDKKFGEDLAFLVLETGLSIAGASFAASAGEALVAARQAKVLSVDQAAALAKLTYTGTEVAKGLKKSGSTSMDLFLNVGFMFGVEQVKIMTEKSPEKRRQAEAVLLGKMGIAIVSGAIGIAMPGAREVRVAGAPGSLQESVNTEAGKFFYDALRTRASSGVEVSMPHIEKLAAAFVEYQSATANYRMGLMESPSLPFLSLLPVDQLFPVVKKDATSVPQPTKEEENAIGFRPPKATASWTKESFHFVPADLNWQYAKRLTTILAAPKGENKRCTTNAHCDAPLVCNTLSSLCEYCKTDVECERKYDQPLLFGYKIRCFPTLHFCALNRKDTWRTNRPNSVRYDGDFEREKKSIGSALLPTENFPCSEDADCDGLKCNPLEGICEKCSKDVECAKKHASKKVPPGWSWKCHPTKEICAQSSRKNEWRLSYMKPPFKLYKKGTGPSLKPKENFECTSSSECAPLKCNMILNVCESCSKDAECTAKYPGKFLNEIANFSCNTEEGVCGVKVENKWISAPPTQGTLTATQLGQEELCRVLKEEYRLLKV